MRSIFRYVLHNDCVVLSMNVLVEQLKCVAQRKFFLLFELCVLWVSFMIFNQMDWCSLFVHESEIFCLSYLSLKCPTVHSRRSNGRA